MGRRNVLSNRPILRDQDTFEGPREPEIEGVGFPEGSRGGHGPSDVAAVFEGVRRDG